MDFGRARGARAAADGAHEARGDAGEDAPERQHAQVSHVLRRAREHRQRAVPAPRAGALERAWTGLPGNPAIPCTGMKRRSTLLSLIHQSKNNHKVIHHFEKTDDIS